MQTNFNEFLYFRAQVYVKRSMTFPVLLDSASKNYFFSLLGLYLDVVRELEYSCDPQSCAGGGPACAPIRCNHSELVCGEGSDKTAPWSIGSRVLSGRSAPPSKDRYRVT